MIGIFEHNEGQTLLGPDDREGLRLQHIATRAELDAAEQANILQAEIWATGRRRDALDEGFLLRLHARMLGEIWSWAGSIRLAETNIGVPPHEIRPSLRNLVADARLWRENNVYPADELAVRFHHRLVAIHPFPNGNGRHARLAADLVALALYRPRFSWGGGAIPDMGATRNRYIAALRAADNHDMDPLLDFARA